MTNRDIERKFMFDLEMGVFNKDSSKVINFKTNEDSPKLLKILDNLGRSDNEPDRVFMYKDPYIKGLMENKAYITIDMNDSSYAVRKFDNAYLSEFPGLCSRMIDIPEYVKEYKLN